MHPRASQATFFVVVIVLLAGLLVGCGGGGESQGESQGGSQDGGSEKQGGNGGSEQQNGGSEGGEESQQVKIALGTIGSVTPDRNRFTLEPSTEEQGEKPIPFKVGNKTQITIAGEPAEIGSLEEGAQANVNYVTVDGKNRARSVEVIGG